MNPTKAMAHRAGALYFLFSLVAIVREVIFPKFMTPGDAAATVHNITSAEPMYRLGVGMGFATLVMFIFLVAILHQLLEDADRSIALLMVLLVAVGVAVSVANIVNEMAPLGLLGGASCLSVFTRPQLEALALGFLRLHSSGATVATAFWGLWLFPFGILVVKSRCFPRILGILLRIAGFAHVAFSVTSIVLPEYRQAVSRIVMPLYFGEVPIILSLRFGVRSRCLRVERPWQPERIRSWAGGCTGREVQE